MQSFPDDSQMARLVRIREDTLAYLKPFQRATVKHIEELFADGATRVLVSDEVGLGKTLIAKGVVATTSVLRKEENDDFFKVVYVCSNAAIANQNLAKLTTDESLVDRVDASAARLSMQHFATYMNERRAKDEDNYVQLIPLTPGTSFNVANGQGTVNERALIFAVLRRLDLFEGLAGALEDMFKKPAPESWRWWRDYYEEKVCSEEGYLEKMAEGLKPYRESLSKVADYLRERAGAAGDRADDRRQIGSIRRDFALLSIESLDPDLVIMDEFQRFRDLLDTGGDDDLSLIARRFLFSEARGDDPVRVLLLSATPFKPFSTAAEDETFFGDNSAKDFMKVVGFLTERNENGTAAQFETVWERYGIALSQYVDGTAGLAAVKVAKQGAERGLRELMARTERDRMSEYADIVEDCTADEVVVPERCDVAVQLLVRRLIDKVGSDQRAPIEYAESCPYLFSYLKGYKLGDKLLAAIGRNINALPFENEGAKSGLLWLRRQQVARYDELDIPNSRFKSLMRDCFETGASGGHDASSLLWVPPSRPYYAVTDGPYVGIGRFSKTLVFSSWTMVPRMASTLLSYEDERRSVSTLLSSEDEQQSGDKAHGKVHGFSYFDKKAERDAEELDEEEAASAAEPDESSALPSNRLRAVKDAERGAAFLLFPSRALSAEVEWPAYARDATIDQLLGTAEHSIRKSLSSVVDLGRFQSMGGHPDRGWYVKAMLLLERGSGRSPQEPLKALAGDDCVGDAGRKLAEAWLRMDEKPVDKLGRMPDDLCRALAEVAVASPAVCAMRTFDMCAGGGEPSETLAFRFAVAFIRKLNTPSATLAVDSGSDWRSREEQSQWRTVLKYCCNGNLQAVLDEYGHQLGYSRSRDAVCRDMVGISSSLKGRPSLYTMQSHYDVDTLQSMKARAKGTPSPKPMRMRTGYAAAFIEDEGGGNNTDRRENLRRAFNSPFRPFVLCSTSVGQEGLDFHRYCRKIVHWNLPGNPIDFEQREGRVNRYESLAIRQNVASKFNVPYVAGEDIWEKMFEKAKAAAGPEAELAGLAPHWGLPSYDEDDVRIERHTYLRKYSRAEQRYERLVDVLVRYRAVLGQPRQEELLAKLGDKLSDDEPIGELFMDLAPFNYAISDV